MTRLPGDRLFYAMTPILLSSPSVPPLNMSSKNFYLRTLGFEDDTHMRPSTLPFPGAFVRGGAQQIHLMELPNPDPTRGRPEHGGRDRHVAFTVENIEPLLERLTEGGVPYTMSKSGRRAVFCRDPDGNALEFMEERSVGTMKEGEKEEL